MAKLPAPSEGIALTHFIASDDIERSRRFYTEMLGGVVALDGEPTIVALASSRPARANATSSSALPSRLALWTCGSSQLVAGPSEGFVGRAPASRLRVRPSIARRPLLPQVVEETALESMLRLLLSSADGEVAVRVPSCLQPVRALVPRVSTRAQPTAGDAVRRLHPMRGGDRPGRRSRSDLLSGDVKVAGGRRWSRGSRHADSHGCGRGSAAAGISVEQQAVDRLVDSGELERLAASTGLQLRERSREADHHSERTRVMCCGATGFRQTATQRGVIGPLELPDGDTPLGFAVFDRRALMSVSGTHGVACWVMDHGRREPRFNPNEGMPFAVLRPRRDS
jgi:hypothetical protein